ADLGQRPRDGLGLARGQPLEQRLLQALLARPVGAQPQRGGRVAGRQHHFQRQAGAGRQGGAAIERERAERRVQDRLAAAGGGGDEGGHPDRVGGGQRG